MRIYYFDASALVKYYVVEPGSQWVKAVIDRPPTVIATSWVTGAEVPAALTKKWRQKEIGRQQLRVTRRAFEQHWLSRYVRLDVGPPAVAKARALIYQYPLRGYDAIQLASAWLFDQACQKRGLGPIVFVVADRRLVTTATQIGLMTEDPNTH